MHPSQEQQRLLQQIPGVDRLLESAAERSFAAGVPQTILVRCIRALVDELRLAILAPDSSASEKSLSMEALLEKLGPMVQKAAAAKLQRTMQKSSVLTSPSAAMAAGTSASPVRTRSISAPAWNSAGNRRSCASRSSPS